MVQRLLPKFIVVLSLIAAMHFTSASAQSTEEKFQDVFVTAGYATAFGAALGAACLSFMDSPQDHLQFVTIGASLGFIGGSILGSYIVLSPLTMASNESNPQSVLLADHSLQSGDQGTLFIRPVFNVTKGTLTSVESAYTILKF